MAEEMNRENRLEALRIAVEQIEKAHGKGAIMKLDGGPITRMESSL